MTYYNTTNQAAEAFKEGSRMSALSKVGFEKTMSSLEIAELTGKEHRNVVADIKNVLEQAGIKGADFLAPFKMESGQSTTVYNLPKFECDLVVSGYSVRYRALIIKRWHDLETAQPQFTIPATFAEALRLSADLQEKVEEANIKIEQDAPKVEFAMAVRNMQGACAVSDFAKSISLGRNTLFKMMRDDGLLMKNNMPYQNRIEQGIFQVIEQIPFTDSKGVTHPAFTTFVTGKGQVYLEKKYRREAA